MDLDTASAQSSGFCHPLMHNLSESAENLRIILDTIPSAVVQVNADGKFLSVNTHGLELYGTDYTGTSMEEHLVKVKAQRLDGTPFPLEDIPVIQSLKSGRIVRNVEMYIENADGIKRPVNVSSAPLYNCQGTVSGAIAVFDDFTERKQADEALRESETKALALVDELEKADKNKNRFLSILSHELRNPLAVIIASLSLLEIAKGSEQAARAKEIIRRQVSQLTKLVDDLLDLTRINQNKIKPQKENINLNETLHNALTDIAPEYKAKGVRLRAKLPKKTPVSLYADPVRISQCVGNILKNALKYTPPGGCVTLTMAAESGEAVIRVQDDGIGIGPELLGHIFEPFTQADDSPDRSGGDRSGGGGLGLGLSIVKGIAELHGGTVTAHSEGPGKGALFTIRLPIWTVPAPRARETTEQKKSKGSCRCPHPRHRPAGGPVEADL